MMSDVGRYKALGGMVSHFTTLINWLMRFRYLIDGVRHSIC